MERNRHRLTRQLRNGLRKIFAKKKRQNHKYIKIPFGRMRTIRRNPGAHCIGMTLTKIAKLLQKQQNTCGAIAMRPQHLFESLSGDGNQLG